MIILTINSPNNVFLSELSTLKSNKLSILQRSLIGSENGQNYKGGGVKLQINLYEN